MSKVFEELTNTRTFDDYIVMAQNELEVSNEESKQVYIVAKHLVKKLINNEGYMGDDRIDLYSLCDYMLGAMLIGMASKDDIVEDAKEFVKKYNEVITKVEVIEEEN